MRRRLDMDAGIDAFKTLLWVTVGQLPVVSLLILMGYHWGSF
jgi:hypothetical protein